ncbi:MAG: YqgE/AlgH family protein [bacterium]|nr:YqgE/AlgH family protein [bacterium]
MKVSNLQYKFIPNSGQLLISEPFLADPNFRKSVVLLCEHELEGSVGFILNHSTEFRTDDIITGLLSSNFPVFYGGPVEPNTLHFIHKSDQKINESFHLGEGVYWGGDIEEVNELLNKKLANSNDFKFFIGYSGWAVGQLQAEIDQKAWWLGHLNHEAIFTDEISEIWPTCVKNLGSDFAYLADSPEDYNWN